MRFLVDLDGVLVDFVAGVRRLLGRDAADWPQASGQALADALGLRSGQIWHRIDEAGAAYWRDLPPTDFADELMNYLMGLGEVVICTAPSQDPQASAGKVMWLQRRFGRRFRDFVITARKELLAADDQLLIDDNHGHVERMLSRGGHAVLVPTLGNGAEGHQHPFVTIRPVIDAWVAARSNP